MKDALKQLVLDCGAAKAAYMSADQIVTDPVYRRICEGNACGMFGKCYMCPPDIGPVEELMDQIRGFTHAILYQSIGTIEDSFDFEGMMEAGHNHCLLSQRIREALPSVLSVPNLHLSGGGCHLCERCAKLDNVPCRYPEKALSSLEGYGIDVYRTSLATDLNYINGENTVTYFGVVLYSDQ